MKTNPVIESVAIAKLKPSPYNPRSISRAAQKGLAASMRRFGVVEPIVWNRRSGHVVGGHQRLDVLRKEGVEQLSVVVVELEPAEEKALNLALNHPGIQGDFTEALQDVLADVKLDLPDIMSDLRFDDLACLGEPDDPWGRLPDGDKPPFQQLAFTLHDEQAAVVRMAIEIAKRRSTFDGPNKNTNGNSIAAICKRYVDEYGKKP